MTGWELVGTLSGFAAALVIIFIFVFNKVTGKSEWKGQVDSDRTACKAFMQEVREDVRPVAELVADADACKASMHEVREDVRPVAELVAGAEAFKTSIQEMREDIRPVAELVAGAETFRTSMHEVREDIREIRDDIKQILRNLPQRAATTGSPLQLTDWGKEISEAIDAKTWANDLAVNLIDQLKGKSPYEIQETARDYCMNQLEMDEDQLTLCKNCAYETGTELKVIKQVLGLELRDVLLRKFGLAALPKQEEPETKANAPV